MDIQCLGKSPASLRSSGNILAFFFFVAEQLRGGTSCGVTGGQDWGSSDAGGGFLKLHKENISIKKTLLG